MSIRKIKAIFKKQVMDKDSAKSILFLALFYPLFIFLFSLSESSVGDAVKITMVIVLAPMFIGSAPMQTINNIIREDKTSGALRALMLSSVKPLEYMAGIVLFLLAISSAAVFLIGVIGGFSGIELLFFFVVLTIGSLLTLILGGMLSLNKGSRSNGIMLINLLSVLNGIIPMLEMFYPEIYVVTQFWYTQQIKRIIYMIYLNSFEDILFSFAVILGNLAVFITVFVLAYRKNRIFSQQ